MPDWIGIRMEDLKPHPANAEVYGPDAFDIKMMESIRKHGILEPLVVTRENVIISGHRRWTAALKLLPAGTELPCRVEAFEDDLAEQEALVAHNLQREKTFSQRMAEGMLLDRIEAERAKRRQGTRTDIPANLPECSEFGETREKVAAKIGMKPRTYSKAKKVVKAAREGDEKAQEAVKAIDAGEMSIDRAYKEVTGKASMVIQIYHLLPGEDAPRAIHLNGEMPAVGERALAHIHKLRGQDVAIDRILYNHTVIDVETLELMVETACRRDGRLPTPIPAPVETPPAPEMEEGAAAVIPAEVLAIGPDEVVTIGVWYQRDGMEKPDYTNNRQTLAEGVVSMTAWMRRTAVDPGYTFPKIKVGAHEVSREVLEALRPWGRMEEEKEHTITVYYTAGGVPLVKFFDGVPQQAARDALAWLNGPAPVESAVRRIHFADGADSDMDISRKGLERLATPAPRPDPDDGPISTRSSGACCPERRLGKDGRCTGCGAELLPELRARYLHLLRDEVEATLRFDGLPTDGVRIVKVGGGYVVVVVPRAGDLPTALVTQLEREALDD